MANLNLCAGPEMKDNWVEAVFGRTYVPVRCQRMSAHYQVFNVVRVEGE